MQADSGWRDRRQTLEAALAAEDGPMLLAAAWGLLALGRPTDVLFCATLFRKAQRWLERAGHRALKVFLVRSVTVEPLLPALQVEAGLHGYSLELEMGGYGSYMEELLDAEGAVARSGAELVCVLLDSEDMAGRLPSICAAGDRGAIEAEVRECAERVGQMLRAFRSFSKARLVLQGCVLPAPTAFGPVGEANLPQSVGEAFRSLNQALRQICREIPDCAFFDADATASQFGRAAWRDERLFLSSRLAVAPPAFRTYAEALLRTGSALLRPARKVLCTDLDNTLWGGVLGEDGVAGIVTGSTFPGSAYGTYQQYLKDLSARGVLLTIVSKNNRDDVQEAFQARQADLRISLGHFVGQKISWGEKVDALRELAAELSLGLDSFVFVDDNPVECAAIRRGLPEVAVVQAPIDEPWKLVPLLTGEWFFDVTAVTADDRHRTEEYRAQAQRAELSAGATSRESFLESLGIVCTHLRADEAPLDRAVQLLAKTNQFNLTTRRHSAAEVLGFAEDPQGIALAVRVRDRFGDAGVVGLALARVHEDRCWIDSLLLSCRVIGRGIETALLAAVAEGAQQRGARWLVGEYLETKKNQPCREFYPDHGFTRDESRSAGESAVYELDLLRAIPKAPAWLTLEGQASYEFDRSTAVPA